MKSKARPGSSSLHCFQGEKLTVLSGGAIWDEQYWQCSNAVRGTHHVLHTDLSDLVLGAARLAETLSETGLQHIDRKTDLI